MRGSRDTSAIRNNNIDPDFINVYGMKLLAGRNLSRQRGSDIAHERDKTNPNPSYNILINAAAARQFGYTPRGAIGHVIMHDQTEPVTIVGVVGDANFDGLEKEMQPFIYFYGPKGLGALSVRIRPGQTQAGLAAIDRIWHRFVPAAAIRRRFQDDSFDKLFIADEQEGTIFSIFVGVAIFIACLGLFGLASFTAERRTKEIGIRKVFGARTRDILRLLLWQFSISGSDRESHRMAGGVVFPAPLAPGLCLQDRPEPALLPGSRKPCTGDRLVHDHHPYWSLLPAPARSPGVAVW